MSEVVQKQVRDGVALLTLNRPDRLNAWTAEMERVYFGMLEQCGNLEEVRVIVVTGAAHAFRLFVRAYDFGRVGKFEMTICAKVALFEDFQPYHVVHRGVVSTFSISARMVRIFDSPNSASGWNPLAAKLRPG